MPSARSDGWRTGTGRRAAGVSRGRSRSGLSGPGSGGRGAVPRQYPDEVDRGAVSCQGRGEETAMTRRPAPARSLVLSAAPAALTAATAAAVVLLAPPAAAHTALSRTTPAEGAVGCCRPRPGWASTRRPGSPRTARCCWPRPRRWSCSGPWAGSTGGGSCPGSRRGAPRPSCPSQRSRSPFSRPRSGWPSRCRARRPRRPCRARRRRTAPGTRRCPTRWSRCRWPACSRSGGSTPWCSRSSPSPPSRTWPASATSGRAAARGRCGARPASSPQRSWRASRCAAGSRRTRPRW